MSREQRRFPREYNAAIIRLLRHKFQPLQKSRTIQQRSHQQLLPEHYRQAKSCHITSLPSLPSAPLPPQEAQPTLLEKARLHVDGRRKEWQIEKKAELWEYVEMFEKRIEVRERGKRGSIELSLAELESRQRLEPLGAMDTNLSGPELSQEERSIMNAKIRRKFNHRKLIDLAKR